MYNIAPVTDSLSGVVGQAGNDEQAALDDLLDLLGLEDYLAISGVEISLVKGRSREEVLEVLKAHNVDPARLGEERLAQLIAA